MTKTHFPRQLYELLSSMRFAISLLTVIAIASIIGTVLRQGEPYTNYVFQFGEFWFRLFEALGLYDVYHTTWFLVILTFLVVSTSVCVYRNTPAMLKEMRTFKEKASEISLKSFAHRAEFPLPSPTGSVAALTAYLKQSGFRSRTVEQPQGDTLIAAKAGTASRWGYIFAHLAIVVICIGGLLDGNVPLKMQQVFGAKKIETRDIPQSQVPTESRLSPANLSFRGNVTIPEGAVVDVAFQNIADGYFVQELPFSIELKKFHIDHYSTGQPKSFASDVVVTDKKTGEKVASTIEVNKPLIFDGVAIYQASFSDGGTALNLRAWDLSGKSTTATDMNGRVHQTARLSRGGTEYAVEFNEFRPFNVENLGGDGEKKAEAAKAANPLTSKPAGMSSLPSKKDLHNVGPSFQYRLRNAQGQAREYTNYMLPVRLEGRWYYLSGVRESPNESFRYMRIPGDNEGAIDSFMRFKATLADPAGRSIAARRFVETAMKGDAVSETLREKLRESTEKVLGIFAERGFEGVASFLETAVPQAEREKAAETYLKILDGAAAATFALSRERAGLAPTPQDENTFRFIRDSLNAMSDSLLYGSPVYLQLASYDEVKASGLQLTRSPGQAIVYTGSLLLVLGIFAMFYIRERRLFLLVKPAEGEVLLAMSTNRKSLDFEREFEKRRAEIGELLRT